MKIADIKPEVYEMAKRAELRLGERFREIDAVSEQNTRKIMQAFQNHRVSDACFAGTTGYGYDDLGRETLDKIYAEVFGTEAALVRIQFVNGTHALTAAMFALAKPGQKILAVTGTPYDTLRTAIGISGDSFGSLRFYGVEYGQVELAADGGPDYKAIADQGDTLCWHEASKVPFVVDSLRNYVFGFENPRSLAVKCEYIVEQGLHGGMYWDYSGDNAEHDLARTVADGLLK